MHYFLTNKFEYNLSGIEHAQYYRWQLFKDLNISANIVTFDYTPELDRYLFRHGISKDVSLNMFDYWQSACQSTKKGKLQDSLSQAPFTFEIKYYDSRTIPEYDVSDRVESITFYKEDRKFAYELWDIRGFKSLRIDYLENEKVSRKTWFNPAGEPVLFEEDNQIIITDHNPQYRNGEINVFNNWSDIKTAWLDHLTINDAQAVFYIDRGEYVTPLVLHMVRKIPIYIILHSAHTKDRNNPMDSPLNDIRQLELENKEHWRGYIASTPQQARDYYERTGIKTYCIPVSFVENSTRLSDIESQKKHRLVYLSRISREKKIEHAIRAVKLAKEKIPDVSLYVYGYVTDSEYNQELISLIKNLELSDNVQLLAYETDRNIIFNDSSLFVLTSEYEGFNMSMLEASARGIPTVAFSVKYGPSYISQKLNSGEIVDYGDIENFAQRIIKLLTNQSVYQKEQNNAFKFSRLFFERSIVRKMWEKFFTDEGLRTRNNWIFGYTFDNDHAALQPANRAIIEIFKQKGFNFQEYPYNLDNFNSNGIISKDDLIIVSYPTFYKTMATNGQYDVDLLKKFQATGAKIILIVQDSLILRELTEYMSHELEALNIADILLVNTIEMKEALINMGITKRIEISGYYPLPDSARPFLLIKNRERILKKNQIIYTGNLGKAIFLEDLKFDVDVYGPNPTEKMINSKFIKYKGSYSFDHLLSKISDFEGFGLVWDGKDVPFKTKEGRYTQYNFPYKAIQYLALEIPIIAWSGSSIGKIVNQKKLGFTVRNIEEIPKSIEQLSDEHIEEVLKNIHTYAKEIANATPFMNALDVSIDRVNWE